MMNDRDDRAKSTDQSQPPNPSTTKKSEVPRSKSDASTQTEKLTKQDPPIDNSSTIQSSSSGYGSESGMDMTISSDLNSTISQAHTPINPAHMASQHKYQQHVKFIMDLITKRVKEVRKKMSYHEETTIGVANEVPLLKLFKQLTTEAYKSSVTITTNKTNTASAVASQMVNTSFNTSETNSTNGPEQTDLEVILLSFRHKMTCIRLDNLDSSAENFFDESRMVRKGINKLFRYFFLASDLDFDAVMKAEDEKKKRNVFDANLVSVVEFQPKSHITEDAPKTENDEQIPSSLPEVAQSEPVEVLAKTDIMTNNEDQMPCLPEVSESEPKEMLAMMNIRHDVFLKQMVASCTGLIKKIKRLKISKGEPAESTQRKFKEDKLQFMNVLKQSVYDEWRVAYPVQYFQAPQRGGTTFGSYNNDKIEASLRRIRFISMFNIMKNFGEEEGKSPKELLTLRQEVLDSWICRTLSGMDQAEYQGICQEKWTSEQLVQLGVEEEIEYVEYEIQEEYEVEEEVEEEQEYDYYQVNEEYEEEVEVEEEESVERVNSEAIPTEQLKRADNTSNAM